LKTLVLGLGNPILTDDGVGIHVVRRASALWESNGVTFAEACVGGLRLLDFLAGYDRVVLVDAIVTPDGQPGDVLCMGLHDLQASLHSGCTHDLSLSSALDLGRGLGMVLPDDEQIVIIAIEAGDVLTFGEDCTPPVQAAIPPAARLVLEQITAGEGCH
jgi:hydrogenase maturation protease